MTKKLLPVIILVLIILTGIWAYSSTQHTQGKAYLMNMPPMPKVTYDEKSIDVYRGSYSWKSGTSAVIADSIAPNEIIKDKNAVTVKPGDTLNFVFPYTPQKAEVKIWNEKEVLHATPSSGIISVPNLEGTYAVEIYAEWKEGHGIYVIKLEVKNPQSSEFSKPKPDVYKPSEKLPNTSMSLEAIAGSLFSQYLEHYKAAGIPEGERLKDYKIDKVKFVDKKENYFVTEVRFSVQGASGETFWTAGNGEMAEDNWVKNKLVFTRVSIYGDVYTLESFGTGP